MTNETPMDQRRLSRANEGRDRYLDMVQKERVLLSQKGVNRTIEQLLVAAGGFELTSGDSEIRENATGDQLRATVPSQAWMPLSIHLIGLTKGILYIAPLYDLSDKQEQTLVATIRRSGFKVTQVERELWDRVQLIETLRKVHDLAADRTEKTLASWLRDLDNGILLNQFVRDLMAEALQVRASDIHITQDGNPEAPSWVRYRVDGELVPMHLMPAEAMGRLTTVIKRDAGLNFGDKQTPQDGRFTFNWQGRAIDVRVAAAPHGQEGEKLTLRLLDRAALKTFDELFRRHEAVGTFLARLLSPQVKGDGGLILLSGPTGSGKTTTLYACVQQIDRRRRHVLTIEDPIEYEMRYATQWQVSVGTKGNDFAALIRASMRHDPDYIVIGEMRDGETVETALRAAESGHTVISTIHADTAVQTIERLRSFLPKEKDRSATYTLSQQIRAVLNQRLVKTLCQGCSHDVVASTVLSEHELRKLRLQPTDHVHTHNENGCDLCNRTGYLGRALLLEALLFEGSESARQAVYHALIDNTYAVVSVNGVELHSRIEGIRHLVHDRLIDPSVALIQLRNAEDTPDIKL
jgi:general secretion pathway protein E